MNDKEFLNWIYERLVRVHKENPNADYMHRFKKIIENKKEERDKWGKVISTKYKWG